MQELTRLEEEREGLQQQIQEIVSQMRQLGDQLLEDKLPSSSVLQAEPKGRNGKGRKTKKEKAIASTRTSKKTDSTRGGRGEVAAKIVEALRGAGANGITAPEIAKQIGGNAKNVSVWFATTGKKNKSIKRMERGRYRLMN